MNKNDLIQIQIEQCLEASKIMFSTGPLFVTVSDTLIKLTRIVNIREEMQKNVETTFSQEDWLSLFKEFCQLEYRFVKTCYYKNTLFLNSPTINKLEQERKKLESLILKN